MTQICAPILFKNVLDNNWSPGRRQDYLKHSNEYISRSIDENAIESVVCKTWPILNVLK